MKWPLRWTLMTASHSSSVMFTSTRSRRMPALLTKTCRSPKASMAALTSFCPPSQSATLSALAMASPPAALISSTTCWAGVRSSPVPSIAPPRSLTTTFAPSWANSSACSRPMPRPAPVMMATRPSSAPMNPPEKSGKSLWTLSGVQVHRRAPLDLGPRRRVGREHLLVRETEDVRHRQTSLLDGGGGLRHAHTDHIRDRDEVGTFRHRDLDVAALGHLLTGAGRSRHDVAGGDGVAELVLPHRVEAGRLQGIGRIVIGLVDEPVGNGHRFGAAGD